MKYINHFNNWDHVDESTIQEIVIELTKFITSNDWSGVRKSIGDVISEYNRAGNKDHKHILSYLNKIFKKLPNDARTSMMKSFNKKTLKVKKPS